MLIIPVIDLMGGKVVHARGGRREQYQPLKSQLTSSVYPNAVIKQLLEWYPFIYLYVADLDAIETGRVNKPFYQQLHRLFPQLTIWLDAGISNMDDWQLWQDVPNILPVIGSESLHDITLLSTLAPSEYILSLDFKQGNLLGESRLLEQNDAWPAKVIVMSLDVVGSESGPDWTLLKEIQSRKPDVEVIAAGGIRGEQDLRELAESKITGALVASALHKGSLDVEILRQIMQ